MIVCSSTMRFQITEAALRQSFSSILLVCNSHKLHNLHINVFTLSIQEKKSLVKPMTGTNN